MIKLTINFSKPETARDGQRNTFIQVLDSDLVLWSYLAACRTGYKTQWQVLRRRESAPVQEWEALTGPLSLASAKLEAARLLGQEEARREVQEEMEALRQQVQELRAVLANGIGLGGSRRPTVADDYDYFSLYTNPPKREHAVAKAKAIRAALTKGEA